MNLILEHEPGQELAVVRVSGPLSLTTVPDLRRAAVKALTDEPDLLVFDVARMHAVDDITLTVFPTIQRQGVGGGTAVMLIGAGRELTGHLHLMGIGRQVPIHATVEDALDDHARTPGPVALRATLLPGPEAGAAARDLVDRACAQWGLMRLADTAALVVTELVANVVQHAGTAMRVSVAHRRRHLHIAVSDESPYPPTIGGSDADPGHGLMIIEGVAAAWGYRESLGGKVVWATLRL